MAISSNLRQLMKERDVSILALAEQTGLAAETIKRARSEKIRLCRLETLAVIAKVLSVKTKDLYEED